MFVYFSKVFTSSTSGSRTVNVTCEQCQTRFYYQLARTGTGRASAPYYLGQAEAAAKAERRATDALRLKLESECELVACPKCRWVNESSIRIFRRSRYRWLRTLAIASLIAGGLLWFVLQFLAPPFRDQPRDEWAAAIPFLWSVPPSVIVATLLWGVRHFLRQRINPNARYPQPPILPPHTPVATVNAPATPAREPRPASHGEIDDHDGWVYLQPPLEMLPMACILCAGAPTRAIHLPFKVSENDLHQLPVCDDCYQAFRRRWFRAAAWALPGALLLGLAIALFAPGPPPARITFGIIAALFASLAAISYVPTLITKPFKFKSVDTARGVIAYKFTNDAYTKLAQKLKAHR